MVGLSVSGFAVDETRRFGQAWQAKDSPSAPRASSPPQDPRKQRPSTMTPTAMITMTSAMPASVSKKRVIGLNSNRQTRIRILTDRKPE